MPMFDKLFRRRGAKKAPAGEVGRGEAGAEAGRKETPDHGGVAAPEPPVAPPAPQPEAAAPEEVLGITPEMGKAEVKAQLAKMFRRYNRLASSLDSASRIEAEAVLDQIVQMREKHLRSE